MDIGSFDALSLSKRVHFALQYLSAVLHVDLDDLLGNVGDVHIDPSLLIHRLPVNDRIFFQGLNGTSRVKLRREWFDLAGVQLSPRKNYLIRSFARDHESRRLVSLIPEMCLTSDRKNDYNIIKAIFIINVKHHRRNNLIIPIDEMFDFYMECLAMLEENPFQEGQGGGGGGEVRDMLPLQSSLSATAAASSASQQEKTIDDLMQELAHVNNQHNSENGSLQFALIQAQMEHVVSYLHSLRAVNARHVAVMTTVDKFDDNLVTDTNIRSKINDALVSNNDLLLLALIAKNMELCFPGVKLYRAQVLAILLMTINRRSKSNDSDRRGGRLLQVKTGEGKSITIAVCAAFTALRDAVQVDIVTSGDILAKRDAAKFSMFFRNLGLTSGHNVDFYHKYLINPLPTKVNVYSCDILYGTAYYFEGDWLFDYMYNRTVSTRKRSFLIVDEVDNMLIDCNRSSVRLGSHTGKYMDPLFPVRLFTWNLVNQFMISNNNRVLDNLEGLVVPVVKARIESKENDFRLTPSQRELASLLARQWYLNAMKARTLYRENVDYVIKDHCIVIIDQITGEMQLQMRWQHGLHEFLELKHGLPLGEETMTSVYYSNTRFFQEYQTLCGLTGTLGSIHARKFLSTVYNVDSIIVPTFKPSRFIQLPSIVVQRSSDWLPTIVRRIDEIHDARRPVLVIVESIADVHALESELKNISTTKNIIRYVDSTDDEKLENSIANIDDRCVILATNLAGRGTDIRINDRISANGGLFVILGFLPSNQRVQDQNFGRSSRQGANGSGQLIIRDHFMGVSMDIVKAIFSELGITINDDARWMMEIRDLQEKLHLELEGLPAVRKQQMKDMMFKNLCAFIDSDPSIRLTPGKIEGIKDRWAVFYARMELEEWNEDEQTRQFDLFMDTLFAIKADEISQNAIHYLVNCDRFLTQKDYNLDAAMQELERSKDLGSCTRGYHLRKAIIYNNRQMYPEAKQELNEAMKEQSSQNLHNLFQVEQMRVAANYNQAVRVMDATEQVLQRRAERLGNFSANAAAAAAAVPTGIVMDLDDFNEAIFAELNDDDDNNNGIVVAHAQEGSNEERNGGDAIAAQLLFGNVAATGAEAGAAADNAGIAAQLNLVNNEQVEFERLYEYINSVVDYNLDNLLKNEVDKKPWVIYMKPANGGSVPGYLPPVDTSQSSPVHNTGYLGYIIGALEIIGGACLCVFTGGLAAAWGAGFIMDGVMLCWKNYHMNATGTYSNSDILWTFLINSLLTLTVGWAINGLSAAYLTPAINQAFGGVKSLASSMFSSAFTHAVLAQGISKFILWCFQARIAGTRNEAPDMAAILVEQQQQQQNHDDNSNILRRQRRSRRPPPRANDDGGEGEDDRDGGNSEYDDDDDDDDDNDNDGNGDANKQRALQEWFDSSIACELNKISPEILQNIETQTMLVVDQQYQMLLSENHSFSIYRVTAVFCAEQQNFAERLLEFKDFITSSLDSTDHHHRHHHRDHPEVLVHKVAAFKDFDSLLIQSPPPYDEFNSCLDSIMEMTKEANPLLTLIINELNNIKIAFNEEKRALKLRMDSFSTLSKAEQVAVRDAVNEIKRRQTQITALDTYFADHFDDMLDLNNAIMTCLDAHSTLEKAQLMIEVGTVITAQVTHEGFRALIQEILSKQLEPLGSTWKAHNLIVRTAMENTIKSFLKERLYRYMLQLVESEKNQHRG